MQVIFLGFKDKLILYSVYIGAYLSIGDPTSIRSVSYVNSDSQAIERPSHLVSTVFMFLFSSQPPPSSLPRHPHSTLPTPDPRCRNPRPPSPPAGASRRVLAPSERTRENAGAVSRPAWSAQRRGKAGRAWRWEIGGRGWGSGKGGGKGSKDAGGENRAKQSARRGRE